MKNKIMCYDDESKKQWYAGDYKQPDAVQLQLGCLQRIARSMERMETNFQIARNRDAYKNWYEQEKLKNKKLRKQIKELKNESL